MQVVRDLARPRSNQTGTIRMLPATEDLASVPFLRFDDAKNPAPRAERPEAADQCMLDQ